MGEKLDTSNSRISWWAAVDEREVLSARQPANTILYCNSVIYKPSKRTKPNYMLASRVNITSIIGWMEICARTI
jgi:hypothetical protein